MRPAHGLWITVGSALGEAVEASIDRDEQFTTTVPSYDVKPRPAELVIVSINGRAVDYLGISQAGRLVATGLITVVISNIVPVDKLTVKGLRASLPNRFVQWLNPPASGAYRPPPGLRAAILEVVTAQRSENRAKLKQLTNIIAGASTPPGRVSSGLEVFERDAVASALQVWGGASYRKRVLRRAVPRVASAPVAPFLTQLATVSVREDPQIDHDHVTFPGLEVARRDVVGSVVLTNGEEYLTILNCNRQPLERTLGVDLIYYNHRYDSFVLVQYKRMAEAADGIREYRPSRDASHAEELKRMIRAEKILSRVPTAAMRATAAFRLSGHPFFVKLCEAKAKAALDAGMVSGMYIPLDLWRRLLRSRAVRGPRGGVAITWENCRRRFNNGEFTSLLRQGWIGSEVGASRVLTNIIEEVLGSGRMLVLAATSDGPPGRDLRRDGLGRFAAYDDPAGAI